MAPAPRLALWAPWRSRAVQGVYVHAIFPCSHSTLLRAGSRGSPPGSDLCAMEPPAPFGLQNKAPTEAGCSWFRGEWQVQALARCSKEAPLATAAASALRAAAASMALQAAALLMLACTCAVLGSTDR